MSKQGKSYKLHYAGQQFALDEESATELAAVLKKSAERQGFVVPLEDGREVVLALGGSIPIAIEEKPSSAYVDLL
jgi:hypothetical protein